MRAEKKMKVNWAFCCLWLVARGERMRRDQDRPGANMSLFPFDK